MNFVTIDNLFAVIGGALLVAGFAYLHTLYAKAMDRHERNVNNLNQLVDLTGIRATRSGRLKEVEEDVGAHGRKESDLHVRTPSILARIVRRLAANITARTGSYASINGEG